MRITDIKITNYRAFYGEHHLQLDKEGKNLMLYGENGSGKSSLFTAMKDFFLSSLKKLPELEENIFLPASKKNSARIEVTIKEKSDSTKRTIFELNAVQKEIVSSDKILISDANKIKGFFDYRSLLRTHLDFPKDVNLFSVLIETVFFHSINEFTKSELGTEWAHIQDLTNNYRQGVNIVSEIKSSVSNFNKGAITLLGRTEELCNQFLNFFDPNMNVKLGFKGITYNGRSDIRNRLISIKISFNKKEIPNHQLFLNEARLSSLAICIYLASIKINPTRGALKVLVLDDLLIGLDMSNRLPLLEILKKHFVDVKEDDRFQIIMTTYDKVWYELVKSYFGEEQWKFVEIFSKRLKDDDFEIPIIKNDTGYLEKAKYYLAEKDYKASAVYIRTEFERLVKTICDKQRLPVSYKKNQKEVTSDDFWLAIESYTDLDPDLIKEIKIHRGVVMNPFSHYDLEKPTFEKELQETITSIEKLTAEVSKIKKNRSIEKFEKEVSRLETEVAGKDKIIEDLSQRLKDKDKA